MAQRQQQPQLRRSKSPRVRRTKQQHAKRLLLRLQTYGDHAAQLLIERQLPESPDLILFLQSHQRIVPQVAETHQPAEARHQRHQVIVQALFLCHLAEFVFQSNRYHRSRPLRIAVVQEQRTGWQSNHPEHPIQRLRQHAVNFPARKTRRRKIQV